MPQRLKALIIIGGFLGSSIFTVIASEETKAASFSVSYDITYTFNKEGSADVVQKTSLKNLEAKLYPSEYSISISSQNVKNVSGRDSHGSIKVLSKRKKGSTILTAKLNDKIVGKNKTTKFTLNYTIKSLSNKKGRMRDLLVPGVTTSEKLDSFELTLKIPKGYGEVYSISPKPRKSSTSKKFYNYTFNKKKFPSENILASFGEYQVVEFSLQYKLKNPSFFKKEEKLLVPRDTFFQEVNYTQLNPRPNDMEVDKDGNYLAIYSLKAGEKREITVKGYAKIDKSLSEKLSSLDDGSTSLSSSKFWEADSQIIFEKAAELKDIESIYDFVTETLQFSEEKINGEIKERLGAERALTNPDKALSSEFVDLFISVARAKKIPSRQVIGFAFGDEGSLTPTLVNGDSATKKLHTWAEYFDEGRNQWVQVDPTWGSTRGMDYLKYFDANHFALFIRDSSSEEPEIPSIFSAEISDSFEVSLVDTKFDFKAKPKVELAINEAVSGFPTIGKVIITNDSGKSLRNAKLKVNAKSVTLIGEDTQDLGVIMPFSQYTVNLKLRSSTIFKSDEGSIDVVLTGQDQGQEKTFKQTKKIAIKPFFSFNTPQLVLLFLLIVTLSGLLYPYYKKIRKLD